MNRHTMKTVLTIAGSDCSGGAGIQADLKTITAHKLYGMSVVTALTAQNTTGVFAVEEAAPEFVSKQLDCVFQDIRPDAVKIGMVSSAPIIEVIAHKLIEYRAENVVLDPVMVSTSGCRLFVTDAMQVLMDKLFPLATVITPNIPEAEALSGMEIHDTRGMRDAAQKIACKANTAVLLKGGHLTSGAHDLLYTADGAVWYPGERIENQDTHGTGCTLSSAIACSLAQGCILEAAVRNAKAYISDALRDGLRLGKGHGPLNHCCRM